MTFSLDDEKIEYPLTAILIISIMIGKRADMRPREVEKMIRRDGWVYKKSTGGHKHFEHPTKPGKVTIPQHPGDTIDDILLKRIKKQAGLK